MPKTLISRFLLLIYKFSLHSWYNVSTTRHSTHERRRKFIATSYHQISLKETFSNCKDMFMDDVPSFFQLLEQHFDISQFIPQTFYNAFYPHLGRNGIISLPFSSQFLCCQKSPSIPTENHACLFLAIERIWFPFFSRCPAAPHLSSPTRHYAVGILQTDVVVKLTQFK